MFGVLGQFFFTISALIFSNHGFAARLWALMNRFGGLCVILRSSSAAKSKRGERGQSNHVAGFQYF